MSLTRGTSVRPALLSLRCDECASEMGVLDVLDVAFAVVARWRSAYVHRTGETRDLTPESKHDCRRRPCGGRQHASRRAM